MAENQPRVSSSSKTESNDAYEPAPDKTCKKTFAASEDSLVRVYADCICLLEPPGYPKRDKQEALPYWVDVQADLSHNWSYRAHIVLQAERTSFVEMRTTVLPGHETESRRAGEYLPQIVTHRDKKTKFKRRDSSSDESISEPLKELVEEDVFLMDSRLQRMTPNLLANSLAARLRQSIPENVNVGQSAMNKLRRDSLKELVYLENLNRQYTNEMNWESHRLDKESYQLLKRHSQMKKHSEHQKKNQEKLESQMRARSGFSSVSLLPRLVDSGASTIESPLRQKTKENFAEYDFVDKEDNSFVKVFKFKGVFQLQNKYGSRNELPKSTKPGDNSQELTAVESDSPIDLPFKSKSRKGLSVTWSQSQYYSNTEGHSDIDSKSPSRTDTRTETSMSREELGRTPVPLRPRPSIKNESVMWRKPNFSKGKSKVETIGVKWQIPAEEKQSKSERRSRQNRPPPLHGVSRNLVPVTQALDREGMSPTRLKWAVRPMRSPSTEIMYKSWVEKLEELKRTPGLPKSPDMKPKLAHQAKMSVVSVPV